MAGRIAFCFLIGGDIKFEDLWIEFFDRADSDKFSIYIHAKDFSKTHSKFVDQFKIPSVPTAWGYLMEAEFQLFEYAQKDLRNEFAVLISDSTIPVKNFDQVYESMFKGGLTRICYAPQLNLGVIWQKQRDNIIENCKHMLDSSLRRSDFRKHHQWVTLSRRHLNMIPDMKKKFYEWDFSMKGQCVVADEWFLATYFQFRKESEFILESCDTWLHWVKMAHPDTFKKISNKRLNKIINSDFLFARKFASSCVVTPKKLPLYDYVSSMIFTVEQSLSDLFDHVFILNLAHRADRREHMKRIMKYLKFSEDQYSFFEATDRSNASQRKALKSLGFNVKHMPKEWFHPLSKQEEKFTDQIIDRKGEVFKRVRQESLRPQGLAELAISLSYMRMWKFIVQHCHNSKILILEDDVCLSSQYEHLSLLQGMRELTDPQGIVLLGHCYPSRLSSWKHLEHNTILQGRFLCTHAFTVTTLSAGMLLENSLPLSKPIDHLFSRTKQIKKHVYAFENPIFNQLEDLQSDIQQDSTSGGDLKFGGCLKV